MFASWRGGLGLPLKEEAQSLERDLFFDFPLPFASFGPNLRRGLSIASFLSFSFRFGFNLAFATR